MKTTDVKATDVEREQAPPGDLVIFWLVAVTILWLLWDTGTGYLNIWVDAHDANVRAEARQDQEHRYQTCPWRKS